MNDEWRNKISKALKGKHNSPSTEFKKGNVPSEEHKKKISDALKGKMPENITLLHSPENRKKAGLSNRGKKRSDETRRKMSESQMGNQNSLGATSWIKGKTKETDERVRRKSEAAKGRIPWNKGKTGVYTKQMLKNILARRIPSCLEKAFQKIIDKYNLPYKYVGDGSFIIGHYNPDFINTNSEKIAIEVYARYHKLKNNVSIEKWKEERNKVFAKYGWKIIYFDETQIKEDKILGILKGESR